MRGLLHQLYQFRLQKLDLLSLLVYPRPVLIELFVLLELQVFHDQYFSGALGHAALDVAQVVLGPVEDGLVQRSEVRDLAFDLVSHLRGAPSILGVRERLRLDLHHGQAYPIHGGEQLLYTFSLAVHQLDSSFMGSL